VFRHPAYLVAFVGLLLSTMFSGGDDDRQQFGRSFRGLKLEGRNRLPHHDRGTGVTRRGSPSAYFFQATQSSRCGTTALELSRDLPFNAITIVESSEISPLIAAAVVCAEVPIGGSASDRVVIYEIVDEGHEVDGWHKAGVG